MVSKCNVNIGFDGNEFFDTFSKRLAKVSATEDNMNDIIAEIMPDFITVNNVPQILNAEIVYGEI